MESSRAGDSGNRPWNPRTFHGSASAPQPTPRCKRSSTSGSRAAARFRSPRSASRLPLVSRLRISLTIRTETAGMRPASSRLASE